MSFLGTTNTDFVKLPRIPDELKSSLIDYSVTDYYSIRDSLIKYVRATYPNDFTNFHESDMGVMFIELVSYMGAVLSNKADMLANESFIRTVKTRANLDKLLELIGAKMKGPSSSVGSAKLTFDSTGTAGDYKILPENRIVSLTSPIDNKPVTYTLYDTTNGVIKRLGDDGSSDIVINRAANQMVYSSLVFVEGSIVIESGIFNNIDSFKSVRLSKAPVIDGSVEVHIQDTENLLANGVYRKINKLFFASGSFDKCFAITYDDDYRAIVQFGDNKFGISPSKSSKFTIIYRVGGGSRGNQDKEVINSPIKLTKISDSSTVGATIENSTNITGGANAETMIHAKMFAALDFKRQNRVVTLSDYSAFVNSMTLSVGTIGKAVAVTRKAFSSSNVIDIYLLEKANNHQLQRATTNTKSEILSALENVKMVTDHVVICDGLIRTLDLNITVKIDRENSILKDSIKLLLANKILAYFNVDRFNFGQPFEPSDLSRVLFQTNNVRYASIDNVINDVLVDFNEIIQLNNFSINMVEV